MTLIEKFENAPFQDVGTFNSIFPWNPILGFDSSAEVKIGKIVQDSERLVFVNEVALQLDLIAPKKGAYRPRRVMSPTKAKAKYEKEKQRKKKNLLFEFSTIFKELTFGEYYIYNALMEIGEVEILAVFAFSLGIDRKSMIKHMKNLTNKGYVEKTTVYKGINRD